MNKSSRLYNVLKINVFNLILKIYHSTLFTVFIPLTYNKTKNSLLSLITNFSMVTRRILEKYFTSCFFDMLYYYKKFYVSPTAT